MPLILVSALLHMSPFKHTVWPELDGNFVGQGGPITVEEVRLAIQEQRFLGPPTQDPRKWLALKRTRREHIERVAHLVQYPDSTPIELDVGVPSLRCYVSWPLQDGHHRLAAAIYRGDPLIEADISGDVDYASKLYGVPVPRCQRERVLEAVRRYPRMTSGELSPFLEGLTRGAVAGALSALERQGRIRSTRQGPRRSKRYHLGQI